MVLRRVVRPVGAMSIPESGRSLTGQVYTVYHWVLTCFELDFFEKQVDPALLKEHVYLMIDLDEICCCNNTACAGEEHHGLGENRV